MLSCYVQARVGYKFREKPGKNKFDEFLDGKISRFGQNIHRRG